MGIQVCLISWMNIDYKENGAKKSFSCQIEVNIVYPNKVNMIVMPLTKKMEQLQVSEFVSFHG